jgi:hypothetical protein
MAIRISETRKVVLLEWDEVGGDMVKAENADDVSLTHVHEGKNEAYLTYATGYHGEDHVSVLDADGNVVEEGDISV